MKLFWHNGHTGKLQLVNHHVLDVMHAGSPHTISGKGVAVKGYLQHDSFYCQNCIHSYRYHLESVKVSWVSK